VEVMRNQLENENDTNTGHKSGWFEKFLNLFGFEAEEVVEEAAEGYDRTEREPRDAREREKERERGKLVTLANSNKQVKMIIMEPSDFEEVQTIVDHLKNRQTVILNLDDTDKATARRIADFLGGAIYALDGSMQKVSGSIFLFTPTNIEVTIPLRTALKEREKDLERGSNPATLASNLFKNERDR
jgi:cell division inhibitor SepF